MISCFLISQNVKTFLLYIFNSIANISKLEVFPNYYLNYQIVSYKEASCK